MRGVAIPAIGWLVLTVAWVPLHALSGPRQGEASPPSAEAQDHKDGEACLQAVFKSEVKGGESFSRSIGGGLVFHLIGDAKNWGWHIVISPEGSDDDWAYPVNPPLRSNNSQAMETGWGLTVKEQLKYPHEVRFVLDKTDYEKIDRLVIDALWPYSAADPENAPQAYFAGLTKLEAGAVVVTALAYDKSGSPNTVKWMHFKAVLNVPQRFPGNSSLIWKPAACAPSLRSEFESLSH